MLWCNVGYAGLIFGKENLPIVTKPEGAECNFKNNKGKWNVTTPGIVKLKISKDNLNFSDQIRFAIKNFNRPIIIFPQGTRTFPNEKVPFKKGVGRIYKDLNIFCQPVAVNSGHVWPKNGYLKSNKIINVSILKPISPGLSSEDFLKFLENDIYNELDKFN